MSTMVDISTPLMLIDMDVRPHMAHEKHRCSLIPSSSRAEVKSMAAPRAALVWAGLSVHSTDLQLMPQHTAKLSSCLHGQLLRAWLQLACRHLLPRLRSCNKFQGITKHGKKRVLALTVRNSTVSDANHLRQDSQLQWAALRSSCWYCSWRIEMWRVPSKIRAFSSYLEIAYLLTSISKILHSGQTGKRSAMGRSATAMFSGRSDSTRWRKQTLQSWCPSIISIFSHSRWQFQDKLRWLLSGYIVYTTNRHIHICLYICIYIYIY